MPSCVVTVGSFMRKVHKPIVLSNGQVIPAGCNIEVAAYNSMHDPDNIANPMEFDALRWYRQRQGEELKGAEKASAESANQMVTVSPTALTFGYGRHACPGRFFAANEIKMIMGHAILDYDFKNADGSMERYPNLKMYETVSRIYSLNPMPLAVLGRCTFANSSCCFLRIRQIPPESSCLRESQFRGAAALSSWSIDV